MFSPDFLHMSFGCGLTLSVAIVGLLSLLSKLGEIVMVLLEGILGDIPEELVAKRGFWQ